MCREGQSCCNISFETENLVNITNFLTQLVTTLAKTGKREIQNNFGTLFLRTLCFSCCTVIIYGALKITGRTWDMIVRLEETSGEAWTLVVIQECSFVQTSESCTRSETFYVGDVIAIIMRDDQCSTPMLHVIEKKGSHKSPIGPCSGILLLHILHRWFMYDCIYVLANRAYHCSKLFIHYIY